MSQVRRGIPTPSEARCAFGRPLRLPTVPAVATHCLHAVEDGTTPLDRFVELFSLDPALAHRLLLRANAKRDGGDPFITTIADAVHALPRSELEMLALDFAVSLRSEIAADTALDVTSFGRRSIWRALVARALARRMSGVPVDEAYALGLLLDLGTLLLLHHEGEAYVELHRELGMRPGALREAERKQFPGTRREAIAEIDPGARLPMKYARALGEHHAIPDADWSALDMIACAIGGTTIGLPPCTGATLPESDDPVVQELERRGVPFTALEEIRTACADEFMTNVDPILAVEIDTHEILREANRLLHQSAGQLSAKLRSSEAERDDIRRDYATMRHAIGQYRDRAARDPLTDLLNRGALLATALQCADDAAADGTSLTVLFLDLDNFKRTNDVFGHGGGDAVLRCVAAILDEMASPYGVMGRYGGEEFVGVLVGLSQEQVREWIRETLGRVRGARPIDGVSCSTTCSMGAVWLTEADGLHVANLISVADELMYQAKRSGKDCGILRIGTDADDETHHVRPLVDEASSARSAAERVEAEALLAEARRLNNEPSAPVIGTRKRDRAPALLPATIVFLEHMVFGADEEPCTIRNASVGGLGVVSARRMASGSLIELRLQSDDSIRFLVGVVAFCRRLDGTLYEIGVQLLHHADAPCLSGDRAQADRMIMVLTDPLASIDPPATRRAAS